MLNGRAAAGKWDGEAGFRLKTGLKSLWGASSRVRNVHLHGGNGDDLATRGGVGVDEKVGVGEEEEDPGRADKHQDVKGEERRCISVVS